MIIIKRCFGCEFFYNSECHRYPPLNGFSSVSPSSWCGEFKPLMKENIQPAPPPTPTISALPKEVIPCPVEVKEKEEKEKVVEKAVVSEPEPVEFKKRGWPLGKPRK